MSAHISTSTTLSIPRSLKLVGIIGGVWAILTILAAVFAYLPGHPDFSLFSTYLSDIGDTPGWLQILFNAGTLIAVPIRYLVLVLLALRLNQLGAGRVFTIAFLPILSLVMVVFYLVFLTLMILYEQGVVSRSAPVIWEWLAISTSIVWMLAQSIRLGRADQAGLVGVHA